MNVTKKYLYLWLWHFISMYTHTGMQYILYMKSHNFSCKLGQKPSQEVLGTGNHPQIMKTKQLIVI